MTSSNRGAESARFLAFGLGLLALAGCPKTEVPTDDAADEVGEVQGGEELGAETGVETVQDPPPTDVQPVPATPTTSP